MGFWNKLIGREEPHALKPEIQQALDLMMLKTEDKIRVEVITKFSAQMNQVFGRVGELRKQVDELGHKNNKLAEELRNSQTSLGTLNSKLQSLENSFSDNAAKTARGISMISNRIDNIASEYPKTHLKSKDEKMTPFRNAPK